MRKIRKLYYFDKKNAVEMISFINNIVSDNYINNVMFNPFAPLHHFLPLKQKFLPESYILEEDKVLKGLATIIPSKGNQTKIEIQKLFFEEGKYSDAIELIQFIVSKYKAMGAFSVIVKIDDFLPELLSILVSKCGFCQISYEKLWRINKFIDSNFDKKEFRPFKNSDSLTIANMYNDSILPHYRLLLNKDSKEFQDNLFKGLSCFSEYKYIIEDKISHNINGCLIIKTYDNSNYIVDIIQNSWVELDINSILAYATYQIKKRRKKFALFVRTKRYTNMGDKQENLFMQNKFNCVQNQFVLTNSSAKILEETCNTGKFTVLGEFCPTKPMLT